MENLEKSCNFKMVIFRPGKVLEKTEIVKVLEKSWKFVISTCSFEFEFMAFVIINVF